MSLWKAGFIYLNNRSSYFHFGPAKMESLKSRKKISSIAIRSHFQFYSIRVTILAWRIPGTVEPGGLLSVGSQRVRHDCSDLAAAAAAKLLLIVKLRSFPRSHYCLKKICHVIVNFVTDLEAYKHTILNIQFLCYFIFYIIFVFIVFMFHKCFRYLLNNINTVNNLQSSREYRKYKKHILKYQKINKHIKFNCSLKTKIVRLDKSRYMLFTTTRLKHEDEKIKCKKMRKALPIRY